MSDHEHRMEQDGGGWRAALSYGRHVREFFSSDVNRAVVREVDPQPGETVLDIGAGMGAGTFPAVNRVGETGTVHAVEPTSFMRGGLAIRRLASGARRRIVVHNAVAEALPLSADSVDAAWAVNVLHHVTDLTAAVAELDRVLRPGGRVLLIDEDFDDPHHPDHERMKAKQGHHHGGDGHHTTDDDGHHHLMVDIEVLGDTFREAGFADVDASVTTFAGVPARLLQARKLVAD